MSTPEKLLTSKEVRRRLRCSTRTLYKYRAEKLITFHRVNTRRFLYEQASVEALLKRSGAAHESPGAQ